MHLFLALIGKVFAIIIGLRYFKEFTVWYKLIFFQVVIAAICESYGYYLIQLKQYNAWLYNLYYLPEFWLLGIAVGKLSLRKRYVLVYFIIGLGTLIWSWNVYENSLSVTANWAVLYNSIVLVTMLIIVLYNCSWQSEKGFLQHPDVWIAIGMLIYFALNLPLFGLLNYLIREHLEIAKKLFWISNMTNVVRYSLIGVGFYLLGKQPKRTA